MSRKGKVGIDYFSHDVDLSQDKKVKIVKAKHGLVGYAVYLRLLEELYRDTGYYLFLDDDFNVLFSDDNNIDLNVYILILNDCIQKKLFDEDLYDKYSVLTSVRVQENYCAGTERRKEVVFIEEYLLIDPKCKYKEKTNVIILPLNVNINQQNADSGTQSKVKESKEKVKRDVPSTPLTAPTKFKPEITKFVNNYQGWALIEHGNMAEPVTDLLITNCSDVIDKLIRIDGFTQEDVFNSIEWASNDDFWSKQIKSLAGLRRVSKNKQMKFKNMFSDFEDSKNPTSTGCSRTDHNIKVIKSWGERKKREMEANGD